MGIDSTSQYEYSYSYEYCFFFFILVCTSTWKPSSVPPLNTVLVASTRQGLFLPIYRYGTCNLAVTGQADRHWANQTDGRWKGQPG